MRQRLPAPPLDTKCVCGHRYSEHVPGGDRHACQHGAKPPFSKLCPCGRFRPKSERRAGSKTDTRVAPETAAERSEEDVRPESAG